MIVYIKTENGNMYASPVFAEFGKSWKIKSIVLDESQKNLILLNIVNEKRKFNFFYVDENVEEGWMNKENVCGFSEIIENKELLDNLNKNKKVSIEGLECAKKYKLPLDVKTKFNVKNEKDYATFSSLCWGLHDAHIENIARKGNDLVIDFDTTWEKHIIMTFHDVIEEKNLDKFMFLYGSEFKFVDDGIMWFSNDFQGNDDEDIEEVYVKAKKISYELVLDDCIKQQNSV